jgi:hypothetical protein
MSKPFTEDDLSTQLQQDRNWRLREMSDLKSAINNADEVAKNVLLRALVTVCYAHWEGSVRLAAQKFLQHVALRKLTYQALDVQFLRNYFLPRLASLSTSKASVADRCKLLDDILSAKDLRYSKANNDLVSTRSNLNSDVFKDICLVCGVDFVSFEAEFDFIDIFLLKRRNEIAHGEDTRVGVDDVDALIDRTLSLMRGFGNAIENRVYLKGYKVA